MKQYQLATTIGLILGMLLVCAAQANGQVVIRQSRVSQQAFPPVRTARLPVAPAPEAFIVEPVAPPNPDQFTNAAQSGSQQLNTPPGRRKMSANVKALLDVSSASRTVRVTPAKAVQDMFGEPQDSDRDFFGERGNPAQPGAFSEIPEESGTQEQVPDNPFGERPNVNPNPVQPDPLNPLLQDPLPNQNPFGSRVDPNPITPPMDTRQNSSGAEPVLPRDAQYTPNPNEIQTRPPVPGQADPAPEEPDDPGSIFSSPDEVDPTPADPETRPRDDENDIEVEVDDGPVARDPGIGRVYLPARTPTEYATPRQGPYGYGPQNGYPPQGPYGYPPQAPGYAGLPGPYGYGLQPSGNMPYPPNPWQMPGYPGQWPVAGGCGPGCVPANPCSSCSSCNSVAQSALPLSTSGCGSCGTEPAIETCATESVGQPLLDSGCTDRCGDVYTDVVSDSVDPCNDMSLPFYLALHGGSTNLRDLITRSQDNRGVFRESTGTLFGFALGRVQGRNLRTELEVSYRSIDINGLDLMSPVSSQFLPVNGDLGVLSGMLNGYWAFDGGSLGRLRPYVGGGVGFAFASPDIVDPAGMEIATDNDQSSFAWQWMAGASYQASSTMEAFVEYRYFAANSFNLQTELDPVSFAPTGNGSGDYDFRSSNILFGFRIKF